MRARRASSAPSACSGGGASRVACSRCPVALIFAHDTRGVGQSGLVWLAVSSLAAVAAFAPFYRAVRLGPVPLVAGIGALEGAVAASISFATGERLPALTLLGLLIALGGMIFVLTSVRVPVPAGHGHPLQAGLLATLAASLFGLSLFAGARAIEQVPELWLPAGSRTFGTVLIALPLAAARPPAAPRALPALRLLLGARAVHGLLRVPRRGRLERHLSPRRACLAGLGGRHGDLVPRARRAPLPPPAGGHRRTPHRRRAGRGDPLSDMFIGVLLATITAVTWGSISVLEARVSRALGGQSALAWVFGVGLVVILPIALIHGIPDASASAWAWAMVSAVCSLAGLALMFTGLQYGRVGLVTATISVQGAFASIYAAIGGESLHPLSLSRSRSPRSARSC